MTADEAVMGGTAGNTNSENTTYYLYTGDYYWLATPSRHTSSGAGVFNLDDSGGLNHYYVNSSYGIRGAISLKIGTKFEEQGDGTPTNPYVVKMN